jgi:amino acid transporter
MQQLRRSLGLFDVALFFVIACTNLQWVATAAAAGPSALPVWLIGAAAMFVPIAIVVMHLSRLYPEEGGMYVWTKRAFGPFAGYMTGWTYWCTNLPYFPALLYFTAGNALFISGGTSSHLSTSPLYFIAVSLAAFTLATILNVVGLDVGKWLNNVGAISRFAVTIILIALGIYAWSRFGSATPITATTMRPSLQIKDLIFWSVIAFAWTGPEAIPFMAGEVRNPRRNIPLGLALAIPGIAIIYILGTVSVLVAVASGHVSALYGVTQAIAQISGSMHIPWLTVLAAVLVTVSCVGSTGAWLGIAARIPFVAGIDRYLPPAFARLHPRWGSPVVALLTQAGVSTIFILLGQGGTTVKGAYNVLVSATVLITMVPFLMLFTAALKLGQRPIVAIAACVGLFTTISSLILSAIPAADDPNKPLAVAKVLLLTLITLGAGVIFYMLGRRRALTVGSRGAQLGL